MQWWLVPAALLKQGAANLSQVLCGCQLLGVLTLLQPLVPSLAAGVPW
jgi:hypothetical protein